MPIAQLFGNKNEINVIVNCAICENNLSITFKDANHRQAGSVLWNLLFL